VLIVFIVIHPHAAAASHAVPVHATTVHTHHEYEKDTDQYPDAVGL
jgi:hypothetical protein